MSRGKHDQVDMLHGPLLGKLILFALPLALSSILQQLFNAVDIAVLGQFATSQDQAAVGCTSAVINMFLNLFLGISVGANVVIATYIGQRDKEKVRAYRDADRAHQRLCDDACGVRDRAADPGAHPDA